MDTTTQTELKLDNITVGFGIASVIVIILNTILTIVKELYLPLLTFMKSISILGVKHHWLVHGLTVLVLFCLFGWFFSKKQSFSTISSSFLSKAIAWATILGSLGIFIFLLIELYK